MKKLLGLLAVSFSLSLSAAASADVAPDPCEGKAEGDVCETYDQQAGTCQQDNGFLDCVANAATTSSSTTSGAGGGGEGGSDGTGGSGAGTEDEGGCSVAAVGAPIAAGSMSLFALALVAGLRLGGRRRKQG
jgi:hypothetical protein